MKLSDEYLQDLAKLEPRLGTYDEETLADMARELLESRLQLEGWRTECGALRERLAAAESCKDVLAHAYSLDYFSEGGSTEAWAKEVLEAYDKVVKNEDQ